ncbi:MAG: hypothetical protein PHI12_06700 [Dehalococcoidales bacterium]|nr:hypothetical protein [Candidatus Omnitrophota bacterium]MDD5510478.1 hypothetical protein [Dehalococcoidales bacterium]
MNKVRLLAEETKAAFLFLNQVVARDFGYYRDCEYRLADALERSAGHLRDTGDFTMAAAVATEETAKNVMRIVGPAAVANDKLRFLFNLPQHHQSVPVPARVILKLTYITVVPVREMVGGTYEPQRFFV